MSSTVRLIVSSGAKTSFKPSLKAAISVTPGAVGRLWALYNSKNHSTNMNINNGNSTTAHNSNDGFSPSTQGKDATNTPTAPALGTLGSILGTSYLKISVRSKGCSGNAYVLDWTDTKLPFDEEVSLSLPPHTATTSTHANSNSNTTSLKDTNLNGNNSDKTGNNDQSRNEGNVKLLIDSKALLSIIGSEMDYIHDELGAGFVFRNPNVKETCGCGMSFFI